MGLQLIKVYNFFCSKHVLYKKSKLSGNINKSFTNVIYHEIGAMQYFIYAFLYVYSKEISYI